MADLIWQGEMPPLPAAPNRPPPDLNNLDQYTYNQIMTYMADFPPLSEAIYRWGRSPAGFWADLPQFHDEDALIEWHLSLTPEEDIPFTAAAIANNNAGWRFPIDRLIQQDQIHSLRSLHEAGFWEPLGYTAKGISYLKFAYDSGAEMTFNYIAYQARNELDFARAHPSAPRLHGQIIPSNPVNHLDWLLEVGEYKLFTVWWKTLDTPIGTLNKPRKPIDLNSESKRTLCQTATRGMADYLHTYNLIPLAQVHTSNMAGSAWHLAIANPNSNFIHFLAAHANPNTINLLAGHMESPLQLAKTHSHFNHFKNLLSVGADADEMVILELIEFPRPSDKWFRAACAHYRNINPNPGGHAQGGTLVHHVIRTLRNEIDAVQSNDGLTAAQKARRRQALMKRANGLIRIVRAGSLHGRPDLRTRDDEGRTAMALARQYGYHQIYAALEMNPLSNIAVPVVGRPAPMVAPVQQQGQPPIPARGHRYPTRRSRLRVV
ncbi:hypothetical protein BJX76DRAFT_364717 [Aspergillus varians]